VPLPFKANSLGTITAYATLDDGYEKFDLDILDGVAYLKLIYVPSGSHKVSIFFLADRGNAATSPLEIANTSVTVFVTDTEGGQASLDESTYFYTDSDGDGISNLDEILNGTDPQSDDYPLVITANLPTQALSLSQVEAYAIIDDSATHYELVITNGVASGTIKWVEYGYSDVDVYFKGAKGEQDTKIEIANGSASIYCNSVVSCKATFTSDKYTYPDNDSDGNSNIAELLNETNPDVADCVVGTLSHGNFKRDYYMDPVSGYSTYCGAKSSPLTNPFNTSLVSIFITKACNYTKKTGYYTTTEIYSSTDSMWQIYDATNTKVLEFAFVPFVNGSTSMHFVTTNGMDCTGSITNKYSNDSIELDCTKGVDTCKVDYDEQ